MIKALIAVRSGSERVTNKNIRAFADKSLLEYKILQLQDVSTIDGIVVNSNDEGMLSIARKMGCETVLREEKYASSETLMSDVYENMALNFNADTVVYCNVTNPLIETSTIERAIELYHARPDSVRSINTAHLIKEFLYLDGKPLNYEPLHQVRSQDLPNIYALNFAVNVISRADMLEYKNIIAPAHMLLPISELEAVDIDSELDFKLAEYLFSEKRKGRI